MPNPPTSNRVGPEDPLPSLRKITEEIDAQPVPEASALASSLALLPVGPGRMQARWALHPGEYTRELTAFTRQPDAAHLALRIYSLEEYGEDFPPAGAWEDFPADGLDNAAYINLTSTPTRACAALGLVNEHGHFRPLARAEAVALPQPLISPPPSPRPTIPADNSPVEPAESAPPPIVSAVYPVPPLDEAAVTARLPALGGLPAELQQPPVVWIDSEEARGVDLPATDSLNEAEVLQRVLSALGRDDDAPAEAPVSPGRDELARAMTGRADESAPPASTNAKSKEPDTAGASEQLASQWADAWGENAPLCLRAELRVSGRVAPGLRLMLGNEPVAPLPGGRFLLKRTLNHFSEIWPLLAAAGPAKAPAALLVSGEDDARPLLEIHAELEIEGRVNDPAYHQYLPPGLKPDAQGRFHFNRALPQGAALLPGLTLLGSA